MDFMQPCMLWPPEGPNIHITCAMVTHDQTSVVTGSESGVLCIWLVQQGPATSSSIRPHFFCLGLPSGIIALCECTHPVTGAATCSLLASGAVAFCSLKDGRCLGITPAPVVNIPTAVAPLPGLRQVLTDRPKTNFNNTTC